MQPAIKIVKPVDSPEKPPIIQPNERQFWIEQRHALLLQLVSIERRLGIVYTRCKHCHNDRRSEELG